MALTINKNLLKNPNFHIVCERIPNLQHFAVEVGLPGVSVGGQPTVPGPFGASVKQHGDKTIFSDLTISFAVDEDWTSYAEGLSWILSYGKPTSFEQYKDPAVSNDKYLNRSKFSDLSVYALTNKGNSNVYWLFENIHPTDITPPRLTQQPQSSAPLTFEMTFAYDSFQIKKV